MLMIARADVRVHILLNNMSSYVNSLVTARNRRQFNFRIELLPFLTHQRTFSLQLVPMLAM